jgi:hypothetical protein
MLGADWWSRVLLVPLGGGHLPLCAAYPPLLILASQRPFASLCRLSGMGPPHSPLLLNRASHIRSDLQAGQREESEVS